MRKIRILIVAACFAFLVPLSAKAQSCTMDSAMAPSTIDIPLRMETGETARVKVDVFNSGTCTWEPRKVTLSVKVIRKPTRAPYPLEEFQIGEFDLRAEVPSRKRHVWHYEIRAPCTPDGTNSNGQCWTAESRSRCPRGRRSRSMSRNGQLDQ